MRSLIKSLMLSAAVIVIAPSIARAEGYINPWAGVNFGSNVDNGRTSVGVNAGALGAGIIGGEVSFGFSPSFFGDSSDFGSNTVMDLMGNVIIGVPLGGVIKPYVVGGLGMIRTQIDGGDVFDVVVSDNDFAWNVGGGIMGYFSDHVGVRGDVRYLSNFRDSSSLDSLDFDGTFNYWRASIGVVIK